MKLETWLSKRKLTKTAFAELVGVNPSTVTRIIAGERQPSGRLLVVIHQVTKGAVTALDFAFSPPNNSTLPETTASVE